MGAALIVAHGQPSDPGPAEATLADLAGRVAALMPGWTLGSATLAGPGALEAAVARMPEGFAVFPMFMAGGWFTRVHLPGKLAATGAVGWRVLEPFGCQETVQALAVQVLAEAGVDEALLAAHGSFKSPAPAAIANRVAAIARATGMRVACGFIDQEPRLAGLRGNAAVCLPFFAAEGGHVSDDIPAALAKAGFQGRILPALGLDPRVPALIAEAIKTGRGICAAECRWAAG